MSVTINIEHAKKVYDNNNVVIPDLSVQIQPGEFFTLLGPSGCGKTTLLRMIAGFNTIEGGEIKFGDRVINNLPPYKRNIGMVFQNYAVFPHMTTRENVAFGLKEHKVKEPELSQRVNDMLKMVQIEELADRIPSNMSGGQQQRIALARAIVINPDVLLMDEPLSNLDAKLRVEMRSVIRHIQQQADITTVYVTHDQEEALAISDRIAVMNKGVIQQVDNPVNIYRHPVNLFVATFMGQSNLVKCTLDGKKGTITGTGKTYTFDNIADDCRQKEAVICIRPKDLFFADKGIEGTVKERVFFGTDIHYTIETGAGDWLMSCNVNDMLHEVGEKVHVDIAKDVVNLFTDDEAGVSLMKRQ
ncbi:MAG: ABC transporter ATP-binding protein [Erysipelotrichaceae bacterium]|nr:ABC transporter ATP-binding protein [Erysipelotrichaceae bacterium]